MKFIEPFIMMFYYIHLLNENYIKTVYPVVLICIFGPQSIKITITSI